MNHLKTLIATGLAGLLATPLAALAALGGGGPQLPIPPNLVQNPGFETGDFTGWTVGGNTNGGFNGPFYGVDCTDGIQNGGNCAAFFAEPTTATTLTQTFTLKPSAPYTLSFALQEFGDPSGAYPNSWSVSLNGTTLDSGSNLPDGGGLYTLKSYMLTTGPSGNSGVLQFSFLNSDGYFFVDDVSLTTPVPEPTTCALMLAGVGLLVWRRSALWRQGAKA